MNCRDVPVADNDMSDSAIKVVAVEMIQVPHLAVEWRMLADRAVQGRAGSPFLLAGSHYHRQMEHLAEADFHLANSLDMTRDPAGLLLLLRSTEGRFESSLPRHDDRW